MEEKVKRVLEEKIRPFLLADGGDIEYVDFKDGKLRVRFLGACKACPFAWLTFKERVERLIKKEIKEVKEVELVS